MIIAAKKDTNGNQCHFYVFKAQNEHIISYTAYAEQIPKPYIQLHFINLMQKKYKIYRFKHLHQKFYKWFASYDI